MALKALRSTLKTNVFLEKFDVFDLSDSAGNVYEKVNSVMYGVFITHKYRVFMLPCNM